MIHINEDGAQEIFFKRGNLPYQCNAWVRSLLVCPRNGAVSANRIWQGRWLVLARLHRQGHMYTGEDKPSPLPYSVTSRGFHGCINYACLFLRKIEVDSSSGEQSGQITECLGAVYIHPLRQLLQRVGIPVEHIPDESAYVSFWVRQSRLPDNLDRRLLQALISWFRAEWAFSPVTFLARKAQIRQIQ